MNEYVITIDNPNFSIDDLYDVIGLGLVEEIKTASEALDEAAKNAEPEDVITELQEELEYYKNTSYELAKLFIKKA